MTLSVLFVCTGNICRSPAAERLLVHALPPGSGVSVRSAGTDALVGEPVDAPTAAALTALGADPTGHVAHEFEAAMAVSADLVLTAERHHRDTVLAAAPQAVHRTFTMKEFIRLSTRVKAETPERTILLAGLNRGIDGAVTADVDEITDPFRAGQASATAAVDEIAAMVTSLVAVLDLDRDAGRDLGAGPARRRPMPFARPAAARRPRPS